jgi:hypothetical protein
VGYRSARATEPEKQVAEFLGELGLEYKFEYPIFIYDDRERPRLWAPDFFLPELMVHVEVCGSDLFNYTFREKMYEKNNICVIFSHIYKGEEAWKPFLVDSLEHFGNERLGTIYESIERARNLFEEKTSRSRSLASIIGDAPSPILFE